MVSFVSAGLVAGAALIASPIIIHLINRMRYRRVRFAAMEFLLQAQQKNRRRILIEQLLLLLLRILIVLLIVMLIAGLTLSKNQLSMLRGTAQSHHLILIDDSGSMQEMSGQDKNDKVISVFAEAKEIVKRLAERGAKEPGTQKITVLLLSSPDKPLFREEDANEDFIKALDQKLKAVECSHRQFDVVKALKVAARSMQNSKADESVVKQIHFVSDFRQEDWKKRSAIVKTVEDLTEQEITINFIRAVEAGLANLAVTKLTGNLQSAAVGTTVFFQVSVKNFGTKVAEDITLRVVLDGVTISPKPSFDKIGAGKTEMREFSVTFETPGYHRLRVQFQSDTMPKDNVRYFAIENLPEHNHVLLIDGDPDPKYRESKFMNIVFSKSRAVNGVKATVRDPSWLRKQTLEQLEKYKCIYIMNARQIPEEAVETLETYVRNGGGLAWFMLKANQAAYQKLYKTVEVDDGNGKTRRVVNGLFPVPLGRAAEILDDITGKTKEDKPPFRTVVKHEILNYNLTEKDIKNLKVYKYWPVSTNALDAGGTVWDRDDARRKDGVTTLAVLRNQKPFLFEHRLGRGRIITSLTAVADEDWTNWRLHRNIYYPFHLQIQQYIARSVDNKQRVVGFPLREQASVVDYTQEVQIAKPNRASTKKEGSSTEEGKAATKKESRMVSIAARTISKKHPTSQDKNATIDYYEVEHLDTDVPGIYKVRFNRKNESGDSGGYDQRIYAYNMPVAESDMALASSEEMQSELGENELFHLYEHSDEAAFKADDPGEDMRQKLLILLVLFLIIEQIIAYRMSYHREDGTV